MLYVGTYETKTYTAYFYDTKIIITTPRQCFRVYGAEHYYAKHLTELKLEILGGEIKSISDMPQKGGKLIWENCHRP